MTDTWIDQQSMFPPDLWSTYSLVSIIRIFQCVHFVFYIIQSTVSVSNFIVLYHFWFRLMQKRYENFKRKINADMHWHCTILSDYVSLIVQADRTTNVCEVFHNKLNAALGRRHPTVFKVTEVLKATNVKSLNFQWELHPISADANMLRSTLPSPGYALRHSVVEQYRTPEGSWIIWMPQHTSYGMHAIE